MRTGKIALLLSCAAGLAGAPAMANDDRPPPAVEIYGPADEAHQATASDDSASQPVETDNSPAGNQGGGTDILSGSTLSVLFDGRLALANGERSFTDRGLGKTRFGGTASGDYKA